MPKLKDILHKLQRYLSSVKNNQEILTVSPVPFPKIWKKRLEERPESLIALEFNEIHKDLSSKRFRTFHNVLFEQADGYNGLYIPNIYKCWNINPENLVAKLDMALEHAKYVMQNSKRIELGDGKTHWQFYYKPNAYHAIKEGFANFGNVKIDFVEQKNKASLKITNTFYHGQEYKNKVSLDDLMGTFLLQHSA